MCCNAAPYGSAGILPNSWAFMRLMGAEGLTETTAVGTVSTLDHFKFGTVGRPMPGVEVRIADDGEVLLKGPGVMSGYHDLPEATAEAIEDVGGYMNAWTSRDQTTLPGVLPGPEVA